MSTIDVQLQTNNIVDRDSFHSTCKEEFGFPDFYGRNMNAWIDCMSYLDEDNGMSKFHLHPAESFNIHLADSGSFRVRAREVFESLLDCTASVNQRYIERGSSIRITITLL